MDGAELEYRIACIVAYIVQLLMSPLFYIHEHYFNKGSGLLDSTASRKPERSLHIPTSSGRQVKIDIYEPQNPFDSDEPADDGAQKLPKPVHVNFHGSGFVMKVHGCNAEFCAYLANALQCTVIDADYAKAPEHPFPAAVDDALDVFAYVASRPDKFDLSKVTAGGFSSGGNIALLAATRLGTGGKNAVKAVVAWYAPTNMMRQGVVQVKEGKKESPVFGWLHKMMRLSYLPPKIDRKSPKVSPLFADTVLFPPTTLIVGEDDKLLADSKELAERLKVDDIDCVLQTVPGADHGWDVGVKKESPLWSEREKALALTVQRLKEVHEMQKKKKKRRADR